MKIRVSRKAKIDIKNIWDYTSKQWSIDQAEYYVSLILEEFDKISEGQNIARNYNDLRMGYYGTKVNLT